MQVLLEWWLGLFTQDGVCGISPIMLVIFLDLILERQLQSVKVSKSAPLAEDLVLLKSLPVLLVMQY